MRKIDTKKSNYNVTIIGLNQLKTANAIGND